MIDGPQASGWLSLDAAKVFCRIAARLWGRGEWREEYRAMAEVAAVACSMYVRLMRDPAASPLDVEEWRQEARKGLVAMGYLQEGRAHLAAVDTDGNDRDLVEICRPL